MTLVAADIGGTHARFALVANGALKACEKIPAADFPTLTDALQDYCVRHDAAPAGGLLIATAARFYPDGIWRFTNRNPWIIDREALAEAGWHTQLLVNDFAASAHGALALPEDDLAVLKEGSSAPGLPRAILGPGTGLGMAYALPETDGGWRVQETFGGHMLAASLTDEQAEIIRLLRGLRETAAIVPEDLASGRSLPLLYQAAALFNGRAPRHRDNLLGEVDDPDVAQGLRLFHEFLGLFAQNVAVTTHAFGGLYLDGGLIQRLHDDKLFDEAAFRRGFAPPLAAVVRDALDATPVWLIRDPFVALHGLLSMQEA